MLSSNVKKITIRDVAKSVGMSVTTVSGVLNNIDGFAEATRKKIWDAVHELNYLPNTQARKLRNGSNNVATKTGLFMHITHLGQNGFVGNMFEAMRSQLLEYAAYQNNCFLTNYYYYQRQGFRCPLILEGMIDGVILGVPHPEIINILHEKIPTVLLDVPVDAAAIGIPVVNMDNSAGYQDLFKYAAMKGHKKFSLVHAKSQSTILDVDAMFRYGLTDAALRHQVALDGLFELAVTTDTYEQVLAEFVNTQLDRVRNKEISLLVVPNISMAETIYEKLSAHGISFPEDVALVSNNCFIENKYKIGGLNYDWPKLTGLAISVLKDLIDKKASICNSYSVKSVFFAGKTL